MLKELDSMKLQSFHLKTALFRHELPQHLRITVSLHFQNIEDPNAARFNEVLFKATFVNAPMKQKERLCIGTERKLLHYEEDKWVSTSQTSQPEGVRRTRELFNEYQSPERLEKKVGRTRRVNTRSRR